MSTHKRRWCTECVRWVVICGVCGNNVCNGGSGKSAGLHPTCDCEEAYAFTYGEVLDLPEED